MATKFLKGNLNSALYPLLGIVVGSLALIMTLSLGDGAKILIEKDLSAIAANKILLGGDFDERDSELIERLPFVKYATFPEARASEFDNLFRGYSSAALKAMNLPNLRDDEVILDQNQFKKTSIGSLISFKTASGKKEFRIRDYYSEESPFETMKSGNRVLMNSSTFKRYFRKYSYNTMVVAFPEGEAAVDYISIVLKNLNRSRTSTKLVKVLETPDVYKKVDKIKTAVSKGLFILSLISLTLGGVGILNLIAQSVRERGSYIGILRTVGISKKTLIEIFLIEAGVLVISGAAIGTIVGIILSIVAGKLLRIPPHFDLLKIFYSLIVTSTSGIIFGLLPLKKIKELEIVEALKI
ncbi:MAG: ABC transporter permease [Fusobacteriaceae bacterium]